MHDGLPGGLGLQRTEAGHALRVFSEHATSMELRLFDERDPDFVRERIPMQRGEHGIWSAQTPRLTAGTPYALGVDGPQGPTHAFDPGKHARPPHAKGLIRTARGQFRATVIDPAFDWAGSVKPSTALDRTVIYEAHVKGMTKLSPHMPEHLRGTYAGLAHPSTIDYLRDLGVTAVELLPVHAFVSEQRLIKQGRGNYWGYNTINFFTPHSHYASRAAQLDGTGGVMREFKGMVKLLHEAGLEVILDVVFNHTAEEGRMGPAMGLRLIDNAAYYRQTAAGDYIDVTGCGNTVDYSTPAACQLVLDSLRYWANDVQIDGFRFDLAVALGRDASNTFTPEHPLLRAIATDESLAGTKMIAEPWDVGMGGWQVGNFGEGWSEWNDGYRDRVRQFWLSDYRSLRHGDAASSGVGPLAHAISGSQGQFATERGPLASVNFITAHDGFTLTDLVRYDSKHNEGNGEQNRDGTNENRSYNHGVEGRSDDDAVHRDRRTSMRNLLGTLLVSAGVPMLTMGDEFGRSQRGNNNPYCHDSALTWMSWSLKPWQAAFLEQTKRLVRLRHDHPALRPLEFGDASVRVAGSTSMEWYNRRGEPMTLDDWDHSRDRTLQYLAASTPMTEAYSRVLVVMHGSTHAIALHLPHADGATGFELLWDSSSDALEGHRSQPGDVVPMPPMSMRVYRVDGEPSAGIPEAELIRPRRSAPAPQSPAPSAGDIG